MRAPNNTQSGISPPTRTKSSCSTRPSFKSPDADATEISAPNRGPNMLKSLFSACRGPCITAATEFALTPRLFFEVQLTRILVREGTSRAQAWYREPWNWRAGHHNSRWCSEELHLSIEKNSITFVHRSALLFAASFGQSPHVETYFTLRRRLALLRPLTF